MVVAARAPLPAGAPNYVTARGLKLLRDELVQLENQRAVVHEARADGHDRETARRVASLDARISATAERLGSARLVDQAPPGDADEVRFGATVTVRSTGEAGGTRRITIVGVDEADPAAGRVAFVAPMARALLGRRVGEAVNMRAAGAQSELEILTIAYES